MTYSIPTPRCAAYEALLPLLTTDLLTSAETRDVLAHAAECAHCRAQLDEYAALEAAGRRYYRPGAALPASVAAPLKLDDIIHADMPDTPSEDIPAVPVPRASQRPQVRRSMWLRILPEIAAVLVVALLATTLLVNHIAQQSPLTAEDNAIIFADPVTWGKLELNGRAVDITKIDSHHPLILRRGRNTISYVAPPFRALTCTISAPADSLDTCMTFAKEGITIPPVAPYAGRIVDLQAQPGRLPVAALNALATAIQQQLDPLTSTVHVLPGDHYVTSDGAFAVATRAFDMTVSFQSPPSNIIKGTSATCVPGRPTSSLPSPLCMASGPGDVSQDYPPKMHWSFLPDVLWRYTLPNGQKVTMDQGTSSWTLLDITIGWNGAWQMTLGRSDQQDILGGFASDELLYLKLPYYVVSGFNGSAMKQTLPVAEGLLIPWGYSKTGTGDINQTAYVLYRAGALTAIDSNAQRVFPTLPSPSAHELAIARQLGFK